MTLSGLMLVTMSACSGTDSAKTDSGSSGSTAPDSAQQEEQSQKPETPVNEYTIHDEVVFENDVIKVTLTDVENTGKTIDFGFEAVNKSSNPDHPLVAIGNLTANGWGCYSQSFAENVSAGETKTGKVSVMTDYLKMSGIETIDQLLMAIVVDMDTYYVTVYPTGKQESDIVIPERKKTASEAVLLDNEECTVVALDVTKEQDGNRFELYMENKNPTDGRWFRIPSVLVNGKTFENYGLGASLCPGTKAYYPFIYISDADLSAAGINEIEEISFDLLVTGSTYEQEETLTYKVK